MREAENVFLLFFVLFLNSKLMMYTLNYHFNYEFKDDKRQSKSQRGSAMKSSPIGLLKRTGLECWLVQSAFNPWKPLTSTFWGCSCSSPHQLFGTLLPRSQKVPGPNWNSYVILKKQTNKRQRKPSLSCEMQKSQRKAIRNSFLHHQKRRLKPPLVWQLKTLRHVK